MASAKQIAWRKKFARMSKAGAFKKKQSQSKSAKNPKSIGAKKSKSTTHRKTLKSNPHNPVVEDMKKLEKKYYIERSSMGDATVFKRAVKGQEHSWDKEMLFIPNLSEFASEIDIDPDNDGQVLFMLDSGGAVKLPT